MTLSIRDTAVLNSEDVADFSLEDISGGSKHQQVLLMPSGQYVVKLWSLDSSRYHLEDWDKRIYGIEFADFISRIMLAVEKSGNVPMPEYWSVQNVTYHGQKTLAIVQSFSEIIEEVRSPNLADMPLMDGSWVQLDREFLAFAKTHFLVREREPWFWRFTKSVERLRCLDWDSYIVQITLYFGWEKDGELDQLEKIEKEITNWVGS